MVIPTYNRRSLLVKAVESAQAQSYRNIEVIVVDNASDDDTHEVISLMAKSDSRIRILTNRHNIGPVLNWKVGIESATGDYIKILWSDDVMEPSYLDEALNMFRADQGVGFVFTQVAVGESPESADDSLFSPYAKSGIHSSREYIVRLISGNSFPYSPGCAIFRADLLRKSFITENELFPNRYLENGAGPDLLMFLMSAHQSEKFGYINEPLSFFRDHDGSITVSCDSGELAVDYAKSIVWFLHHHYGQEVAYKYWLHTFKKAKLFRPGRKDRLGKFSSDNYCMANIRLRHWPYLARCLFFSSKKYLPGIFPEGNN